LEPGLEAPVVDLGIGRKDYEKRKEIPVVFFSSIHFSTVESVATAPLNITTYLLTPLLPTATAIFRATD
jgi:hypothetical protein